MKPNFKILDGLRGIAAAYVLINHSRGNLLMGGNDYAKIVPVAQWNLAHKLYFAALQLTSLGREFVILFFVLSGFSIAYSLQKKGNTLEFYRRRLIRLYPPYVMALLWAAFIFFIVQHIAPAVTDGNLSVFNSFSVGISNLLYVPNGAFIGQFWSLTYEVIFYLIIPLCILKKEFYYAVSLLAYAVSILINWNSVAGNNIVSMYILDYNIYFAVGVWLFHNYKQAAAVFAFKKRLHFYFVSLVLFLAMVIIKFKTSEYNKISLLVAALFSILLIVNFLQEAITNKLLSFLGSMSYTLYLTHLAGIFLLKSILLRSGMINSLAVTTWYIWPIGVLFGIGVSYLLYFVAEYPSKKILERIRKQRFA